VVIVDRAQDREIGSRWRQYQSVESRERGSKLTHARRVRSDRIDTTGVVTLRVNSKLHHIGIGRTHAGTHVKLLIQDHDITIINATTGETLRQLTIDPTKDYQPTGKPPGPQPNKK
jgi:hypothetical protein